MATAPGGLIAAADAPAAGRPTSAQVAEGLPVASLLIDPEGRVAWASGPAERLLNLSERAMAGRQLGDILRLPPQAETLGQGWAIYDTVLPRMDGQPIRGDFISEMLPDHPDWRVIVIQTNAASQRGEPGARDGGRVATAAAAMLAHEIKNPLSGIRGAAQLLARGAHGDDATALTALIVAEVDRIAALIGRMEVFSDTRALSPEPTNLYPLIAHARRVALAGFAAGATIVERFDPSLPPALVDPGALTQVLLNLLKNAAEAAERPDALRITVSTTYRGGISSHAGPDGTRRALPIELCVTDNGPGAPAELVDSLFDPFVSGRREGQGLGLAIVAKLVRDMGGLIAYAREGTPPSTVMRVLLPRGDR